MEPVVPPFVSPLTPFKKAGGFLVAAPCQSFTEGTFTFDTLVPLLELDFKSRAAVFLTLWFEYF